MKRFLALFAALVLAGCTTAGAVHTAASAAASVADASGAVPPAPLTATSIDEKALTIAAQALDTTALSASALVKAHVIVAGSPRALGLATALDKARHGVNAAAAARRVGNAASYRAALADAESAIAEIRTIIGG